jgi:DNA-directed RNA polymerase specialized sigma24 family protein
MSPERAAMIAPLIEQIAWWYTRRIWWIDVDDLIQEGWSTAAECDPGDVTDDHFRAYVWRAVSNRLSRYCWGQSAPVSDAKAGPHLAGVHRAEIPLSAKSQDSDPESELLKREAELLIPRLRGRLRRRIGRIYEREWGDDARAVEQEAVELVLVDGVKSNEAARLAGVSVGDLYRVTEWVKRCAVEDSLVRMLLVRIVARRRDL